MYVLSRNMKKYQIFLSKNFLFLEVKISIYLNRRVFVMGEFKCGGEILEDDPHSGRPVTVATPRIVTKVHDMVTGDRQVTEIHS